MRTFALAALLALASLPARAQTQIQGWQIKDATIELVDLSTTVRYNIALGTAALYGGSTTYLKVDGSNVMTGHLRTPSLSINMAQVGTDVFASSGTVHHYSTSPAQGHNPWVLHNSAGVAVASFSVVASNNSVDFYVDGDIHAQDDLEANGGVFANANSTLELNLTVGRDLTVDDDGTFGDWVVVGSSVSVGANTITRSSASFNGSGGVTATYGVSAGSVTTTGVIVSSRQGSDTLTDITEGLTWASLHNVGSNQDLYYRPLVYGSFSNSNITKPQVGIWWRNDNNFGTSLYFGTSNSFATGITKTIQMDYLGNLISGSSITTTGGLFGGSLAVSGSTFTTSGGAYTAPSQPFGMLVGAVEQGLADGSSTERDVFFSTLHSSSVGMGFNVNTASETLTAQIEGLYDCSGQVAVKPASLSILRAWLYHYHAASASWQVVARDNRDPISGGTSTAYVQKKLYLKAGDGVGMTMAVAGATATQEGDHEYTWLQCAKIR